MRVEKASCLFIAQVCLNNFAEETIVTDFSTWKGREMIRLLLTTPLHTSDDSNSNYGSWPKKKTIIAWTKENVQSWKSKLNLWSLFFRVSSFCQ